MFKKLNYKKVIVIIVIILVLIALFFMAFSIINNYRRDYETVGTIEYNYYKIYSNKKYGVINTKGECIIQPEYDNIIIPNPSKPVFICIYEYNITTEEYKQKILNDRGEEIFTQYESVSAIPVTGIIGEIPYEKIVLSYKKEDKYGLINLDGKEITSNKYEEILSVPYKEGELLVKENGKYGVINNKGVNLIKPQYDSIIGDGYFTENEMYKASGYIVGIEKTDGMFYGYINNKGKKILETEYDAIYRIGEIQDKNVFLIASKKGQTGLLENKKIRIELEYEDINYEETSNLVITKENRKYGVKTLYGQSILPEEYDEIQVEGIYILATKNNETTKYDYNGIVVEDTNYTRVTKTENEKYYITINSEYLYGVLGQDKNVLIESKYEYLENIFDNLFIARNDKGKYGVINASDEEIVPFNYDVVQNLKDTNIIQTMIVENNLTELFNKSGEKIISQENIRIITENNYIKVYSGNNVRYFDFNGSELESRQVYSNNNYFAFERNGKWGFENIDGSVTLIDAIYDRVTEFNKYGFAGIKKDNKWGIVNLEGEIIVEPIYEINDQNIEPDFLGKYYRENYGYMEASYTDDIKEQESE